MCNTCFFNHSAGKVSTMILCSVHMLDNSVAYKSLQGLKAKVNFYTLLENVK